MASGGGGGVAEKYNTYTIQFSVDQLCSHILVVNTFTEENEIL
jgi:hypothetical protein